jgi:hypothetical protein
MSRKYSLKNVNSFVDGFILWLLKNIKYSFSLGVISLNAGKAL